MKMFIVSCLLALMLTTGCASVSCENGVLTTRAFGQVIESGYTDRSGIRVTNTYADCTMFVTVQLFELTPIAFRGYGVDPLLGTPPKRILGKSATYKARGADQYIFATSPGIVMPRGFVEVTAIWFDSTGKQQGDTASIVLSPGDGDRAWKYDWTPYRGQHHNRW